MPIVLTVPDAVIYFKKLKFRSDSARLPAGSLTNPMTLPKLTAEGSALVFTALMVTFLVPTSAQFKVAGVMVILVVAFVPDTVASVPGVRVNPPPGSNGTTTFDFGVIARFWAPAVTMELVATTNKKNILRFSLYKGH